MVGRPLWFGPHERPLFGWVHTPRSGFTRGGVVMCPSLGLEAGFAHFALRRVAEELAELGFAVLRFDYDGTGDSFGAGDDPGRVPAWKSSVRQAVDFLRSITDRPVTLFGTRLGALLAADEAVRRGGVDGLVLWDPPRSGRSYIREQRTRHAVSLDDDTQDSSSMSLMGMSFSPESLEELGAIDLRGIDPLPASHCLLLERPGRSVHRRKVSTLDGGEVTVVEAADQDELLLDQVTPVASMRRIVDWFSDVFDGVESTKIEQPEPADECIRVRCANSFVTERIVSLGPHRLFGIVSEPEHSVVGPTVVFVPDAFTPHVGLSRMWVELARSWASQGYRVLRFDLSGNGDSPTRPDQEIHKINALEHLDDVADIARAVSPTDPSDLILIGICTGAYHCLEAALELSPRGICIMNPTFAFTTPEWPPHPRRKARQATRRSLAALFGRPIGRVARRFSPVLRWEPYFNWNRWFEACYWQSAIKRRRRLSKRTWRVMNRLMLNQLPTDVLGRIVDAGTDVLVVVGDSEVETISLGAERALRRLDEVPNFRFEALTGLDHSVLRAGQSDRIMNVLTEHMIARFRADNGSEPETLANVGSAGHAREELAG